MPPMWYQHKVIYISSVSYRTLVHVFPSQDDDRMSVGEGGADRSPDPESTWSQEDKAKYSEINKEEGQSVVNDVYNALSP